MATTTVPEVTKKAAPVTLTANAVTKVKEIMGQQNPVPAGLRIGVVGGGCSGFSYSMQFENGAGMMDKTFEMEGLKVFVDATSVMYLNGCIVDYVETDAFILPCEAGGSSEIKRPYPSDEAVFILEPCVN